eukprot:sb/3472431/
MCTGIDRVPLTVLYFALSRSQDREPENKLFQFVIVKCILQLAFGYAQAKDRLLGTQVSLLGATTNTTCWTFESLNEGLTEEAQTYTIQCPVAEKAVAVFIYDDVVGAEDGDKMYMNIKELGKLFGGQIDRCDPLTRTYLPSYDYSSRAPRVKCKRGLEHNKYILYN